MAQGYTKNQPLDNDTTLSGDSAYISATQHAIKSYVDNRLSSSEATDLTDGNDSSLHYHASDRDLANATNPTSASSAFVEASQDAVGAMVTGTATIDLVYTDSTPRLSATVKDNSITEPKLAMNDSPADGEVIAWNASGSYMEWVAQGSGDFVLIADSVLGADAANFDFTSIPATFKHLRLVLSLRSDSAATSDEVEIRYNNDSSGKYDSVDSAILHTATVVTVQDLAQTSARAALTMGNTAVASDFGIVVIDIPDYASENKNKDAASVYTCRVGTASGQIRTGHANIHWRSTAAISRITVFPGAGTNWKQYSRATLYGVK